VRVVIMTQMEGVMKARNLRLALGLFFAAMAALLFLRRELAPELAAKFRNDRLVLGAWFALVLSGWNVVRWYVEWAAARRPRGVNPLSVKTLRRDDGANPGLDFERTP
jgi:hypothetical protein